MRKLQVKPSSLDGAIILPPSKSQTMRALYFALLAEGESHIEQPLLSPDTQLMFDVMVELGAEIKPFATGIKIKGNAGQLCAPSNIIDCGNSGQILRFIAALTASDEHLIIMTGDESVRQLRPLKPLLSALRQLGANCKTLKNNEMAPVIIQGPIKSGEVYLDGADSQPVSALLMAATQLSGETTIHVTDPGETPWIDLTLSWLKRFNCPVNCQAYEHYIVQGGQKIKAFDYRVPGDLSALAFPVVAAIITNSALNIENVDLTDCQGDKIIIELLSAMGVVFDYCQDKKQLTLAAEQQLKGATLDINSCIDSITILAVCACFAEGETQIVNAEIARNKECDRIAAISTELKKMGADIDETQAGLVIRPKKLYGAKVKTYDDHRMAMSLTVAALAAEGKSEIDDCRCILKSFPNFVEQMQQLGASINAC